MLVSMWCFEAFKTTNGGWTWRLVFGGVITVFEATDTWSHKADAENAALRERDKIGRAPIKP
jgi:uncharacterized protein YegP (UPF0339 family)